MGHVQVMKCMTEVLEEPPFSNREGCLLLASLATNEMTIHHSYQITPISSELKNTIILSCRQQKHLELSSGHWMLATRRRRQTNAWTPTVKPAKLDATERCECQCFDRVGVDRLVVDHWPGRFREIGRTMDTSKVNIGYGHFPGCNLQHLDLNVELRAGLFFRGAKNPNLPGLHPRMATPELNIYGETKTMSENHQHCVYPHIHMETKIKFMCLVPSSLSTKYLKCIVDGWIIRMMIIASILILDATEDDRGWKHWCFSAIVIQTVYGLDCEHWVCSVINIRDAIVSSENCLTQN